METRSTNPLRYPTIIICTIATLVGLTALGLKSSNCFVKADIYNFYPILFFLFSSVTATGMFIRLYISNEQRTRTQKKNPFLAAIALSLLTGLILTVATAFGLRVAILSTATTPFHFTSKITPVAVFSKSCRNSYSFFNAPVKREVVICGDPYIPESARAGDKIEVLELVGPIGAKIQSIGLSQ